MAEKNFRLIDIGYGYLKYLDENGEVRKTKAVVAEMGESLTDKDSVKGIDIITVDGVDYVVGDAVYSLDKKPITANDNTGRPGQLAYKILGLYALAKTANDGPVTVLTGLPFQNLDEADAVKTVFNGSHDDVRLNGKLTMFNVEDTKVVSQGLGAFYSLIKQRGTGILRKKVLLVDLGFRTINYLPLSNGDIDASMVRTNRELGIQNAYSYIVERINREFKTNYRFHDVDSLLDVGVPQQDVDRGKYYADITDRPYVKEAFGEYANDVWADIVARYPDEFREDLDEVVFSGGTADRVQAYLHGKKRQYCSVIEDAQDVQVLGYALISDKL